jgi:methyl-accepting chemotaxis protein
MQTQRWSHWLGFLRQPATIFGAAIIVIVWVGLAYQLSVEHARAMDTAIERGNSAARLFEETTIRLLKDVDRTLLFMRVSYQENPEHFDVKRLAELASLIGDATVQVGVIGADGYLKSSSAVVSGAPIYLGDRAHFQVHVHAKSDELFIGPPVLGRASGKLSIQVSRRLSKPDGSFDGVIVTSIDPDFAEKFHQSIELGDHSVIVMLGLDGAIRAAYGFSGQLTKTTPVISPVLAQAPKGNYWSGRNVDGINRLVSYRAVAGYPLTIAVGEAESHVFADYARHRVIYFVVVSVLTLLITIGVIISFRRHWMLERINLRFNAALENMTHGLCMFDGEERLVIWNDRYAKLYRLPPELLKSGTPHRALSEARVHNGTNPVERNVVAADEGPGELGRPTSNGISSRVDQLVDGRLIRVTRQPMVGGGWVAIHEDVTADASREEQEKRRLEIDAAIKAFRDGVEVILTSVKDGTGDLKLVAEKLSAASSAAWKRAAGAVQASDKATANVGSAATAAVGLENSINDINQRLNRAAEVARGAFVKAQATNDEIGGLANAAQRIGDVVKLINNIAAQTNLLALNATIEAARAGESGRGFAVVAAEVKALAVQTARATGEIAAQIATVQGSTGGAVEAIRQITASMREIDHYTSAMANAVGQQSAATGEISRHVEGASQQTKMASAVFEEVVGAISEADHSADRVLTTSQGVDAAALKLRDEIEGFLRKVAI